MKILQLCHKPPLPAKDGGTIAMNNITQGLLALGHDVKVLAISTHKHEFESESLPDDYVSATNFESVFVDTRVNLVDAFSNLINRDSYNVSRFFSPDFDRKLTQLLRKNKYDIIHLESLFMTPYIGTCRRFNKAKIVLRSHNLEYMIWKRMASGAQSFPKKFYLKYLANRLKEYEISVVGQVDGIACISSEDLKKYHNLGCTKPSINIPFGIDLEDFPENNNNEETELALFHLGSMDWSPNMEGVIWFLEEVWEKIHKTYPELKLYLAGRNMPSDLKDMGYQNVEIVGEVDSASEFMKSKAIMIVPLLSAGGIRVKIIEGMALKKAIITTKTGAEGIDYTNDKNILIANTRDEFVTEIGKLLKKPERISQMGNEAYELVRTSFDNKTLVNNLVTFYKELGA